MSRPWQVWLVFAACVLMAVAAVLWLSRRVLEAERAELLASARADLEENARLALWRIDSQAAALIARENARPWSAYRSLLSSDPPPGKAATKQPAVPPPIPSPLLADDNPAIKLHFEIGPDGALRSPTVPAAAQVARVVPQFLSREQADRDRQRLAELDRFAGTERILAQLGPPAFGLEPLPEDLPGPQATTSLPPASVPTPSQQAVNPPQPSPPAANSTNANQQPGNQAITNQGFANQGFANQSPQPFAANGPAPPQSPFLQQRSDPSQQAAVQLARGNYEYQARSQALANNSLVPQLAPANPLPADNAHVGVMAPLWFGDELLLVRTVERGGEDLVQGCWLDWPQLREDLLAGVHDLLPGARLLPANPADGEGPAHRMAALPVELLAGEVPAVAAQGLSPIRLSLLVTWGSLAMAALAVGLLLCGVVALSERRAAFVSAVTHELRTPLTTFRMYAEMLAENMVPDEASRRRYLETLRTEADRLTHLVENVLAYARIERGGPGARIGPVAVAELVDRVSERLAARGAEAGFDVRIDADPQVLAASAVADPVAVEQVLFNLVDNACKYARSAENRTLELRIARADGRVRFALADHGPGVAANERKRLFQPFRKSAGEAAHSAPGVGLGLALSRRLARDMGGELALESRAGAGACFVLTLRDVASPKG